MMTPSGLESTASVLVSADWLLAHLHDPELRILDARVADPRLPFGYRKGHIPQAIAFDLARDAYRMDAGIPVLQDAEAIARTLGARGVGDDSTVVIYDEATGPVAGTVFWLVRYLGHRDTRVLHGGWQAWTRARGPVSHDEPALSPARFTAQPDATARATADWIQECAERPDLVLLDTRSEAEYLMGHVPGAVNLSFDEAIDYHTGLLHDLERVKGEFAGLGVTPDKEIVTYCASGSRSSHTYLVLKELGFARVRNYDGSMMDWAQLRQLPVE